MKQRSSWSFNRSQHHVSYKTFVKIFPVGSKHSFANAILLKMKIDEAAYIYQVDMTT